MTLRNLKAMALHAEGLCDREIAGPCGVGRTAIAMRRRRGLASLGPVERQRYLDRFPPRRGRPAKRRKKSPRV